MKRIIELRTNDTIGNIMDFIRIVNAVDGVEAMVQPKLSKDGSFVIQINNIKTNFK